MAWPTKTWSISTSGSTHQLAQQPASYVVIETLRKMVKRRDTGELSCPPAPARVLEKSHADVSLLAGLLIDKFRYHLPLYRQHQRMQIGVYIPFRLKVDSRRVDRVSVETPGCDVAPQSRCFRSAASTTSGPERR